MKKLIPSKHLAKTCTGLRKQEEGRKQLLSSNWATRNDSGSVAALLQHDNDLEIPRAYLHDVQCKHDRNVKKTGVYKKLSLGSNTCYCKEKPVRPLLLRRPNKCLSLEEFEDRFQKNKSAKGRTSLYCFCEGDSASAKYVDLSNQEIRRKYQDELDEFDEDLQITDQRKDYEIFRQKELEQYLTDIGQYKASTIMSTRPYSRTGSSAFNTQGLNSEDLDMFSKKNDDSTISGEDEFTNGPLTDYRRDDLRYRHTTTTLDKFGANRRNVNRKFDMKYVNTNNYRRDLPNARNSSTATKSAISKSKEKESRDEIEKQTEKYQNSNDSRITNNPVLAKNKLLKRKGLEDENDSTNGYHSHNKLSNNKLIMNERLSSNKQSLQETLAGEEENYKSGRSTFDKPNRNIEGDFGYSQEILRGDSIENNDEDYDSGIQNFESKSLPQKSNAHSSDLSSDAFKHFRNNNYFETHGVEEHLFDDDMHSCVHEYELNDRYLAKGVNCDVYGKSRCTICNKCLPDTPEIPYFCDEITPRKLESMSKCYRLGLAPNTIMSSRSRVELKVDGKKVYDVGRFIGRYRRPQYTNTFALRQQKMTIYSYHENY